jgi:hypothetical protein
MWPILFSNIGLVAKTPQALFESRLFSLCSAKLKSASSTRVSDERQKLLRRTDEEWHMRKMAYCRTYTRRLREENPNIAKEHNKKMNERYATDSRFRLQKRLASWPRQHDWVRDELPWKSHRPVYYTSPVQHRCESCGIIRRNGLRLFWQSITQPDSYSCHNCYLKRDARACMPEGYKDVQSLSELAARKKQLEKPKAEAPRTADSEKDKKENSQTA